MILRRKRRAIFRFEIIPVNLIDLFLVILIFFITTTTFLKINSIALDLPDSKSALKSRSLNVNVLNVRKDGKLFLNAEEFSDKELIEKIRQVKKVKPKAVFFVGADKDSRHSDFIRAMDALTAAGIREIAIATEG